MRKVESTKTRKEDRSLNPEHLPREIPASDKLITDFGVLEALAYLDCHVAPLLAMTGIILFSFVLSFLRPFAFTHF